jgi:hypothetical protein
MSYRPITDMWLLARPKVKYYGAYPNGFLERARTILGCNYSDGILHICGGRAKEYPNRGYGPNDRTVDIDASLNPDFVMDVRKELPTGDWKAIIVDPPYTIEDATHYSCGSSVLPDLNKLVKDSINNISIGRCVGILHYRIPACPSNAKEIALIGIVMGNNNNIRCFSVFRREF